MTRKPTVIAAGAVSAVLVASSAAFAFTSGLVGTGPADRVGTFQAIEQRLTPVASTATTGSSAPGSTAAPSAGRSTAAGGGDAGARPGGNTSYGDTAPVAAPANPDTPAIGSPASERAPDTDESDDDDGQAGPTPTAGSPTPTAANPSTTSTTTHHEDDDEHEHEPEDGRESDD